ncbi:MAG: hypothetical protein WC544_04845 [Patescibacteria group bacterium]
MKRVMLLCMAFISAVLFTYSSVSAQQDIDDGPEDNYREVLPPPDLRNWTPQDGQFQLYVNFDGAAGDKTPRIDILSDKGESCLFWMEKLGDTLYVFILPPQHALNDSMSVRNAVDGLDEEFPFVVWAGTKRASYWFSYDSSQVVLDTLKAASFITITALRELPADILTLQLEGKNKNAKIIRTLVKELGNQAKLVQLDEGFYRNYWFRVHKTVVQNWKTNETKTGTLLAFECAPGSRDSVAQILEKYRSTYVATN